VRYGRAVTDVHLPYSRVRVAGQLAFVSGQLGWTNGVFADGLVAQTQLALSNLEACLREHGLDRGDVVKTTVYLTDAADWDAMNVPYLGFFSDPLPARTTVGVDLKPGALVEIDAIALLRG
jgi:2-iminobutanoate/2-iminopropanoate deaminase